MHSDLERLRRQTQAMHRISRSRKVETDGLSAALREILTETKNGLGVARVGVWLFEESDLVCHELLGHDGSWGQGARVGRSSAPAYFTALEERRSVVIEDAANDPITSELWESYLKPLGIGAMVDSPIWELGHCLGVLCLEHEGPARAWLSDEIAFAAAMADFVAMAYEGERRLKTEAALRDSEAKFRKLVENQPGVVYTRLLDGRLGYVSPEACSTLGWTPEELLADSKIWADMALEGDGNRVGPEDEHAVAEFRLRRRDGKLRWMRDSVRVVRDATGKPVLYQGVLQDIHELKVSELARQEAERRFRELFEKAHMLAVILDRDGKVRFVNQAMLEILGLKSEEVIGHELFHLISQGPKFREEFQRALTLNELSPTREVEIETPNGSRHCILFTNTAMRDLNGELTGSASLGVDLTERKRLEEELRQAAKVEAIGHLAGGIAHDFNSFLAAISGFAELALLKLPPEHEAVEYVEQIRSSATTAAGLTRQLLSFARRESTAPHPVDVHKTVRDSRDIIHLMLGSGIKLEEHLGASRHLVRCDEVQLQQILLNLASNARDAMPTGGTLDIRTEDEGDHLKLTVRDTGTGMDESTRERLFEPFFTTKPSGQGTGLGLAITRSIVAEHKGTITVESAPGKGTSMILSFPTLPA